MKSRSRLLRLIARFFGGLHAVLVTLGVIVLVVLAVDIMPDLWRDAVRRGRQPQAAQDVRSPDFRVENEVYRDTNWAALHFHEAARAHDDLIWTPYAYWRAPSYNGRYISIDSRGLRRTPDGEFAAAVNARPVRIFMFGGSTMFGFGARDAGTIPNQLARALKSNGSCAFEVTNFGQIGYVSTQEILILLNEINRGNVPDLVIFYDGANDTLGVAGNGEAGLPQNEDNRRREFNILHKDQMYRLIGEAAPIVFRRVHRAARDIAQAIGLINPATERPKFAPKASIERLAEDVVRTYTVNAATMAALGERAGFRALFFWQPLIYDKKVLTPYEARIKDVDGVRIDNGVHVIHQAYERIRADARLRGMTNFVDLSRLFEASTEPLFLDINHVTERGNELVAAAMLPHVTTAISSVCR